ncbi:hypothetical protein BGZ61DRAFT_521673 [Ilyonectria robusta]|uniref:uncharacterized protein n=1 Tax=Ilyonectria robusta TaxID=1079257 RepID=UPI001E8CA26F|nr:uncharacterized protein BGZ61DRAFT_521673 [Ilyonectria robusta]KAH8670741.1 hypothetical protein BGZ61DRAFT_521673 [Ilyonectria robusta]
MTSVNNTPSQADSKASSVQKDVPGNDVPAESPDALPNSSTIPSHPIHDPTQTRIGAQGALHDTARPDQNTTHQAREDTSQNILQTLQSLGTVVPECVAAKVAATYNGMRPMERFLVETCAKDGSVSAAETTGEGETSSSCQATVALSDTDAANMTCKSVSYMHSDGESEQPYQVYDPFVG